MHKGQIIQNAVKESGMTVTQLAKKLKKSRQSIYNLFENEQVPLDLVLEIGRIIHHDFSKEFKQLKSYSTQSDPGKLEEESVEYWKQKYITLLEEYNQLLKKKKK